ncbi:hypothetical protein BJY24_007187 [Nocardia transvalensis]|uniref:Uncharacterized protein n=1 Tax=Nocardia transvalensis TaxID=37333 RepID=A0A7W9PLB5_9NOCA|nr:hypothetical protein [Nocardia transvalensis]MBB5918275.1 hypothetical protein [Nocardia transvalensis]
MGDILDVLHARCAEVAGEAILAGAEHPTLTLSTREVADLLNHIADLRRRFGDTDLAYRDLQDQHTALRRASDDATVALDRIRSTLERRTAHPEARARQACSIARYAAENLTAASLDVEGTAR